MCLCVILSVCLSDTIKWEKSELFSISDKYDLFIMIVIFISIIIIMILFLLLLLILLFEPECIGAVVSYTLLPTSSSLSSPSLSLS